MIPSSSALVSLKPARQAALQAIMTVEEARQRGARLPSMPHVRTFLRLLTGCIPGVNRRDSADDVFAWSVQTQFPSDRLFGTRIFPSTGWFERPDMIKHPVKCYCVCLQYTTETLPSTLYALVDEAGRQVAKSYIKGGHCPGSEGYTFCITS